MNTSSQTTKFFMRLTLLLVGMFMITTVQAADWHFLKNGKCIQRKANGKVISPYQLRDLFSCKIADNRKLLDLGIYLVDCRGTKLNSLYMFGDSYSSCRVGYKALLSLSKKNKRR